MHSRNEAIDILSEYGKGSLWTKHCFAVADASLTVGSILESRCSIDLDFLYSAALLHDIGRYITHDPIMHGVEGYNLLMELGHEELAFVCASHILFGLNAAEAKRFGLPTRDFLPCTIEERLVPLVDFLIEYDQPTTLAQRFSSLRQRNTGNSFFLTKLDFAQEKATSFMKQLSKEIGKSVEAVIESCG